MTDTVPVDDLAKDTVRRDRWGRYMVVPPNGSQPIGYTRVTTVASTLDDTGGLASWKAAMCATGILMRPGLRSRWEALIAEHADPWYATAESKKACKELIEECAAVGGANDRKEIGTALHTLTAIADKSGDPSPVPHLSAETQAELDTYLTGCALAGIDIDPNFVEQIVVLDDWEVAGTFDRIAWVPGFELPLIADVKTGADLTYSWRSIAVQLAAYSRGESLYVQGRHADGSHDTRLEMPEVDQEWGLVLHLPVGERVLTPYVVDLSAGWDAFNESMWVRQWRQSDVATPLDGFDTSVLNATTNDGLADALERSLAAVDTQRREALQGRIDLIGMVDGAREALRTQWPSGVPTLKNSDAHTSDQLDVIEQLLGAIERAHEVPF